METSRFIQLRKIFDAALLLPVSEWESFLQRTCSDEALRAEVKELLQANLNNCSTESTGAAEPAAPARMIGPYRTVRELGAGGMGVVYLAVRDDGTFRKNVALKLLKHKHAVPGLVQRFHQERQVLANLDHPNIARLLDGGQTAEGVPYYVMEYVEGLALDCFCDTQKLDLADRIRLFQQVVSAVQYLHENLVVHRDLKHSNILVTADGVAKLLDFGIAKVQTPIPEAPDLTGPANRLLTPNYASPEQIAGAPVSKASDIYSLGIILYELLTGRLPYANAASKLAGDLPLPSANIREDLQRTPETTAQLRRRIVGDLDQIVLLCLRRDPRHRYASAAALGEDLQRFLDGRSVIARKEPVLERTLRFLRRKRVAVAVTALVLVSCGVGTWKTIQAQNQARQAQASQEALKHLLDALDQQSHSESADGSMTASSHRVDGVRKLRHALQQDLAPAPSARPAMTSQRQALLERAANYLDGMRTYAAQNAALAAELASAYMEIGVLFQPSYRDHAMAAYSSAARMFLCAAGGDPDHSPFSQQWAFVVAQIRNLGGVIPIYVPSAPSPYKPGPSIQRSWSPSPKLEESSATAGFLEPTPTPVDPAEYKEVQNRLDSAVAKGHIADQVMQSIEDDTSKLGETVHPNIRANYEHMKHALESASNALESGDLEAARVNIGIATECAKRVMKEGGK
jgi:eukaryotic-like serine/threonine-protein kinase